MDVDIHVHTCTFNRLTVPTAQCLMHYYILAIHIFSGNASGTGVNML